MLDKLIDTVTAGGIGIIRKITDLWAGAKSDSLIDYTQVARVEPIVLIDADCLYLESLPEIQQSLLSIFAGYYLQAIAISTTVGKIEVTRHLDKLNPKRNPGDSAVNTMGWLLAQESYKHSLPMFGQTAVLESMALESTPEDFRQKADHYDSSFNQKERQHDESYNQKAEHLEATLNLKQSENNGKTAQYRLDRITKGRERREDKFDDAMKFQKQYEADAEKFGHQKAMDNLKYELAKKGYELQKQEFDAKQNASEIGFGKDTMTTLKELSNLSVGKMFTVEITDGFHKASIPVSIRLMASSVPTSSLVRILTIGNRDNSAKERYHAWKSGRLEFIKDLVFCQDLIDEHRKNLMMDRDGIYSNLMKRARSNQLSTIVSGNPSVATASNMVVMSDTTAAALELELCGKLHDFKTREKMFHTTYLMLLVVVSKSWERCTFYHRGINGTTEVSVRDLKAANKGSGMDVSDVLRAYQVGNSPSL